MRSERSGVLQCPSPNRSHRGPALALVLLGFALAACLEVPITYPEPRRDPAEVARLSVVRGRILELDGVPRSGSRFELLAGTHAFVVSFLLRGEDLGPGVGEHYAGRLDCRGESGFAAGGRYRLALAPAAPSQRKPNVTRYVHELELIDEADGQRLLLESSCGWR